MAAPKAPLLGGTKKDVSLEEAVFGADVKPHLVHEAVRAELASDRSATRAVKTRGMVSGGRSKPWRQKGTGRARAGTNRAVHWTGGSVAFDVRTNFEVKVNKKAHRAALRAALSEHAKRGTLAVLGGDGFDAAPSCSRRGARIRRHSSSRLPTSRTSRSRSATSTACRSPFPGSSRSHRSCGRARCSSPNR